MKKHALLFVALLMVALASAGCKDRGGEDVGTDTDMASSSSGSSSSESSTESTTDAMESSTSTSGSESSSEGSESGSESETSGAVVPPQAGIWNLAEIGSVFFAEVAGSFNLAECGDGTPAGCPALMNPVMGIAELVNPSPGQYTLNGNPFSLSESNYGEVLLSNTTMEVVNNCVLTTQEHWVLQFNEAGTSGELQVRLNTTFANSDDCDTLRLIWGEKYPPFLAPYITLGVIGKSGAYDMTMFGTGRVFELTPAKQ